MAGFGGSADEKIYNDRHRHRPPNKDEFVKNETAGEKPVASRLPLLPGGSGRKSLDRFFQFLRSAESDFLAGFNLNLLAGRGIAADAGCALAHLKNAKAANTNAFALLQMLHNIADQIAEHGLRLLLRHLVRFRERGGEMFKRDGRWCRSFSRNHCHQWDPPLEFRRFGETPNTMPP